ncbi:MAG: hypothetical protein Alpg2KO_31860 [Alphaproteobacteria bacterium]
MRGLVLTLLVVFTGAAAITLVFDIYNFIVAEDHSFFTMGQLLNMINPQVTADLNAGISNTLGAPWLWHWIVRPFMFLPGFIGFGIIAGIFALLMLLVKKKERTELRT